ncbi:MAG: hypothetical protein RLZZ299_1285 [Pseudomonadota bacterium]|jgi:hypothetical protein
MSLALAALLACQENNFSQLTQEDVFQQERIQTVDVLLVVDNSCSMVEEQNKLASNFDSFIQYFDQAEVDWQVGVVTTDVEDERQRGHLLGGDDEIVLRDADGRLVDSVAYDRRWVLEAGVVASLDPSRHTGVSNDLRTAWCLGTRATPGAPNEGCTEAAGGPGVDARYGAVLITEFLADPADVADDAGEWVELTNLTAADVPLGGWTLSDEGRNAWTFPADAVLPAGAARVVGRSEAVQGATWTTGASFTLNDHALFLRSDTDGASEIFAEMVAQGTSGSGLEQGFEAARLALTEPRVSGDNAGFLRPEANLSILFVSDEEDISPMSVADYLRAYADAKGADAYRNRARMNVSAVVGDRAPELAGEPSCASANGVAEWGARYVAAAAATGGLHDSICAEDFSPIVNDLGLTLSGLQSEFELSRVPVLDSLEVRLYASADDDSLLRVLTRDTDYTYVEERNVIRFEGDQVPPSETYILVEYKRRGGA